MEILQEPEKKESFTKQIDLATIASMLSVLSIAGVYYYELGYFVALSIPTTLIKVELMNNIHLLFFFLMISGIILTFLLNIVSSARDFVHTKSKIEKMRSILGITGGILVIIFVFAILFFVVLDIEIVPVFGVFASSIFLLILPSFENANKPLLYLKRQYNTWKTINISIILASMSCVFLYGWGKINAENHFRTIKNSSSITLRVYENSMIKAILDSNQNIQNIVSISELSIDTFEINEGIIISK